MATKTKSNDSIRVSGQLGYEIVNDILNKRNKENDSNRYQGSVVGAGTYLADKSYVMNKMGHQAYDADNQKAVRNLSTTESVTNELDLSAPEKLERKKYLEEVLMLNTKDAEEWFETRFRRDGALRNFGKLMSDRFREALSWKRSLDPRTPPLSASGGRWRARQKFSGYYNSGVVWGDFLEYEDKWYSAQLDKLFKTEMANLAKTGYAGDEPNYMNYHFNMGLGFGESQVFNPPFQYNDLDDPRTHPRYTKIGRVYVKQILNHMPIMLVMPGKIKYHMGALAGFGFDFGASSANADYLRSDNWFTKLISAAWMGVTDVVGTTIAFATSIFTGGKLISFRQQINLFEKYFNNTATSLATNMGLTTPTGMYTGRWKILSLTHILPGIGLMRTNRKRLSNFLAKGFRGNQMIPFMMTKSISCSETISNSTRENPLQEELNAASSDAEQKDKSGQGVNDTFGQIVNTIMTGDISNLAGLGNWLIGKAAGKVSQIGLIKSGGARMSLPEVWDSSSFSRSYSFTFDCFAPYGTPVCKFETWGIQLAFWLTMALPRQVGSFSYVEPFVGRYVMPGKFNINYGIVDSLTIERGDDINDWNNSDNLPRSLKLSVSVKDFQPAIMLPQASRSLLKMGYESIFPPSGFAEYMATVSGLSLADQMDWKRRLGRSFKQWTAGWRRRVNADILHKSISNISPVDFLGGIFAPYGDVYDRIEVAQEKAQQQEYAKSGVNAMRNEAHRSATGTDTGTIFTWPIRQLYRIAYEGDDKTNGIGKVYGRIFKPKDTEQGWDTDNSMSGINENDDNLLTNLGNVNTKD